MRAQEKRPDERAAREEQAPRKPTAPAGLRGPMSPAAALALQHAVGNRAISRRIAEEEHPLQEGPVVQRAGEQQTRQAEAAQGQADPGQADQESVDLEGLNPRERELSVRYGVRIGPSREGNGPHFVDRMLDHIDAALATLPRENLGPNPYLESIELAAGAAGSESAYHRESLTIEMVRPLIPGIGVPAPQRLWARMNRGVRWQRRLMDRGVLSGLGGISRQGDRALGIGSSDRHVMAGVSDMLAHGNLIEWTVRHETGHAADLAAGWSALYAREERFGGWRTYRTSTPYAVAEAALTRAELDTVNPQEHTAAVQALAPLLRASDARDNSKGERSEVHAFIDRYRPHLNAGEFSRRSAMLIEFVRLALAHPWTLDNGGAPTLNVNGRIYHLDHYDVWVSYSAAQREHAVSNYQFSSPREWFAEAYAAYHAPQPGVRERLRPDVQAWFAERERRGGAASG